MPQTTLTTPRLVLREFAPDDWEAVHEYAADSDVVHYMPWGPNTEEQTRGFVERVMAYQGEDPRRGYELAVTLNGDGRLIGAAGLHVSRPGHSAGYVGYCLNPLFWGCGYATEAARALVAFGFGELGLHRIFATCDAENVASERVLEKADLRREGYMREHRLRKGRWRDTLIYAILASEWTSGAG